MAHNIPKTQVDKHAKGISDAKCTQVSNLQKYIQEVLGDTHHTFLQGSYKNDTSISDIKDVDIVAIRKNTYSTVHTGLSFPISIPWEDIFSEIEAKLKTQTVYRWTVTRSDSGKCIEVRTSTFKADVVPAIQVNTDIESDPIAIYSFKTMTEKKNSPRTHYKNGVAKHDVTDQRFKPVVRMFKNWAENHFGNNAPISSHKIESLVHNSPNENFYSDHAESFLHVSAHILTLLRKNVPVYSVCGSEDITSNWEAPKRELFISTLQTSFDNALKAYRATTIRDAQLYWDISFNE